MASDRLGWSTCKGCLRNCCDVNSLSSMYISTTRNSTSRFLNFFKRRVSSFCNKKAAKIIETKPKHVVIVTRITTVCLYDLDDDCEAVHSLQVCDKSCIREENPYGATRLAKDAFLFSAAHGSLIYTDSCAPIHRQSFWWALKILYLYCAIMHFTLNVWYLGLTKLVLAQYAAVL